ncbi:hypothetical protein ABZP36_033588 [Zizania latifolia]
MQGVEFLAYVGDAQDVQEGAHDFRVESTCPVMGLSNIEVVVKTGQTLIVSKAGMVFESEDQVYNMYNIYAACAAASDLQHHLRHPPPHPASASPTGRRRSRTQALDPAPSDVASPAERCLSPLPGRRLSRPRPSRIPVFEVQKWMSLSYLVCFFPFSGRKLLLVQGKIERVFALFNLKLFCPFACLKWLGGKKSDESDVLILNSIRRSLIQQEDAYHLQPSGEVGRYKSPDEHPFFPEQLLEPVLPPVQYKNILHHAAASININKLIWAVYFHDLLLRLVREGSDGNCGSSACCDTIILQALSKRIHCGKFVAEAKFRESPDKYSPTIQAQARTDKDKLMEMLTHKEVEENVKRRIRIEAMTFGQVLGTAVSAMADPLLLKMKPDLVAELYDKWLIPLTMEVEVQYLLRRLD